MPTTSNGSATTSTVSIVTARALLVARLHERLPELEAAVATRIDAIPQPRGTGGPEYAEELRSSIEAALTYALTCIERGEEWTPAVPVSLLAQARLAARIGIGLDTVLRCYFSGYTLIGDFVRQVAVEADLLHGSALHQVLRDQAVLFDRLVTVISEEHSRELDPHRVRTPEARRAEKVRRLLAGDLLDVAELNYDFHAHHVGMVALGAAGKETLRGLATSLDRRLLMVESGNGTRCAWLGGSRPVDRDRLSNAIEAGPEERAVLAIGEPAQGLNGWRRTHLQARAALPVAVREGSRQVRYADVALEASMLGDRLLVSTLRELFLAPLESERDGGVVLRETLCAYFDADRNLSSAAAALGVNRHTVANRLRAAEEALGRPIASSATEIKAALRFEALD